MYTRRTLTVAALLADAQRRLADAGVPSPRVDAELLLGYVLSCSRGRVQMLEIVGEELSPDDAERYEGLVSERGRRVPLQHLLGRAAFRSMELAVGPGVFVPRPETETVAQIAIDACRASGRSAPNIVDLCTGSGAIALSVAREVPGSRVWAVELSELARAWAQRNIDDWGRGGVELVAGDAAAAHTLAHLNGSVDVVVSNPPYVPTSMVPTDPEVRDHDPALALYSGADGLDLIRSLARRAKTLVRPGGILVLEHAEHQGSAVRAILEEAGWSEATTHVDLTARDRCTTAVASAAV